MSNKPENMMPDPEELSEEEDLDLTEEPEQIWPPPVGPPEEVGEVRPRRDSDLPDAGWTQEVRKIDEAIDEIRWINDQLPEGEPGSALGGPDEDIELDIAELDRQVGALAGVGKIGAEAPDAGVEAEPRTQPQAAPPPEAAKAGVEPPLAAVPAAEMEAMLMDAAEARPAPERIEEVRPEPAAQAAPETAERPKRPKAAAERMVAGVVETPRKAEAPPPSRVAPATCQIRDKSESELGQLWGNIFFSTDRSAPRAIIVTAAQRRDGATQIAVALAMIGAEAGRDRRVALVDFNLRNPAVADVLGIPGEPGVTDVLDGRCALEAAMHTLALKNGNELHVLPSGMQVDKPLGLLKSRLCFSHLFRS